MKAVTGILIVGLLASISGTVSAKPGQQTAGLNSLDKDYLKAAAQSNLEEVKLETVVRTHAASDQAKQFGQRMKQDHARAQAGLKAVAAQLGYPLPKDISEEQQHIIGRLGQFKGTRFDAVYKQEMIDDHTEDIALAKREISLGSNPHVVANARKNLVLLQMHLGMAQKLPGGSNGASATATSH